MKRVMIIGGTHPTAVGNSLRRAALARGDVQVDFIDYGEAFRAPRLVRAVLWRLMEKRPPRLERFNRLVRQQAKVARPDVVLCAGNIVLTSSTLRELRAMGAKTATWLTDDPWNEAHRSQRFLKTLPLYDVRLTPRRALLSDLAAMPAGRNVYLPFGYDPEFFHLHEPLDSVPSKQACEIFFAGGADDDRVPTMKALIDAGFGLHLYGDLWARWKETAPAFQGYAKPENLSRMIAESMISLCLVRRANRDGQCMRTYELPAAGACILTEDTPEHRELYGDDDVAVRYFRDTSELLARARHLLDHSQDRQRLREQAHRLISTGKHTYADRLQSALVLLSPANH
jgi:spore maturation protein CgeB